MFVPKAQPRNIKLPLALFQCNTSTIYTIWIQIFHISAIVAILFFLEICNAMKLKSGLIPRTNYLNFPGTFQYYFDSILVNFSFLYALLISVIYFKLFEYSSIETQDCRSEESEEDQKQRRKAEFEAKQKLFNCSWVL